LNTPPCLLELHLLPLRLRPPSVPLPLPLQRPPQSPLLPPLLQLLQPVQLPRQ
jgi:hypothetical protein